MSDYERLSVRDLTFAYGKAEVLRGVSFAARKGELIAILGRNGVGKSTLFRCVLGFYNRGFGGEITVCGESVRTVSAAKLSKRIAYVPQSHSPMFNYSVSDMVLMGTTTQIGALSSPGRAQTEVAEHAMERVGITHLRSRECGRISGGERQLALVARAMAQQAKILVMDEPTANLDFGNQIRVMNRIRELTRDDYTVILSTHNPNHARNFADRVLALNNGVIAADGTPGNVLSEELLCELYNLTRDDIRRYGS
jgi:iron complex transport system ATP-binding protein